MEQKRFQHTTRIDGKVYGLDSFLDRHPGGRDIIVLGDGRDATGMFYSYHRNPENAKKILEKLPIVTEEDIPASPEMDKFDFESKTYQDIRQRVNQYFAENKLSSRGGAYIIFKSIALLCLFFTVYYLSVFHQWTILCPLLGVLSASLGLCIQHDANHGALSSSPFVNRIFGFCDDLIGGSGLCWRHQHNVSHHVFCNDHVHDNDTKSQYPLMRMNPALPLRSYLRFQHIYGPLVYSLIGISYPLGDTQNYLSGRYFDVTFHELSLFDRVLFIIGKVCHVTLFVVLPYLSFGYSFVWQWYLLVQLCGGLWLASVFAVSHNNTRCEHNCSSTDWAEMQIRTSANWASDSLMWNILSGGLNCQIEHHLFPGICHVHYPAISKIVRKYCQENKIKYNDFPTFTQIYQDHFRFLQKMGNTK